MVGGLLSAVGAVVLSLMHSDLEMLRHVLVILSVTFPVSSVVLENAFERFGVEVHSRIRKRLGEIYEESDRLLNERELGIDVRKRVILETGREAVTETVFWLFLRRIKPVRVSM